jgi:hypothetical protein
MGRGMHSIVKALAFGSSLMIAIGIAVSFGCAHGRPINRDVQDEFYTCREYTLPEAEQSIVSAGFPVTQKGDAWVQTGYVQMNESGAAAAILLGAHATASYRLNVRQIGHDVKWSAFELYTQQAVNGFAASNTQQSEHPVPDLTTQHLGNEPTRSLLNRLRRSVCGGDDFFASDAGKTGYGADSRPRRVSKQAGRETERADVESSKGSEAEHPADANAVQPAADTDVKATEAQDPQ